LQRKYIAGNWPIRKTLVLQGSGMEDCPVFGDFVKIVAI